MEKKTSARRAVVLAIGLLVLASLACSQAGEILSPEEATARAIEAEKPDIVMTADVAGGVDFNPGDEIEFVGAGYLVPLKKNPGDRSAYSHAGRGDLGVVLGSQVVEGEVWYQVDGPSGEGWVQAENLEAVGGEAGEEAATEGFQTGDELYLIGKGYLINILNEPGGRLIANQERGVAVTVLGSADYEGEVWYLIDAPTGEGWVKVENLTVEEP
jgi:hypothetical protein